VDNLPTRGGPSENERESARSITSRCNRPFQFILARGQGYVSRERSDIDFTKGQLPHGLSIRIASLVALENRPGATSRDFAADKGRLGRVFIIRGKRGQIASIPRRLRILEQGADRVGLREQQRCPANQE